MKVHLPGTSPKALCGLRNPGRLTSQRAEVTCAKCLERANPFARHADKRLREAAPELAEALQEMMAAHLRSEPHPPESCTNCTRARAALKKAGRL